MEGVVVKKVLLLLPAALLGTSVLAGCGAQNEGAANGTGTEPAKTEKPAEPLKPVTLKVLQTQGYWTEADFNTLITENVKKKYPHITIEFEPKTKVEEALIAGVDVDMVAVWNGLMPQYDDLGLFEDISPLAKKFNMDLGRFDPGALDTIKKATKSGGLYGLPNLIQFNAMYYNKDIFDKFAIPYPKDGMTWEETIELAKKVTRNENGVQYIGLDPDYLTRLLVPLSLGIVEGVNDKTDVNTEPYKRVFELAKSMYFPGNTPKEGIMKGSVTDRFIKDKNVAMLTTINLLDKMKEDPSLNWDIAQFPQYKERPNMFGAYDLHIMTVSKTSKHKDDAMRVMEVLFSDEVQLQASKMGKYTAMKDPKFNAAFVQGVPEYKDKKIQSIFKSKPAPATPPYSTVYSKARGLLVDKFRLVAEGKKDTNTALREAEDEINQIVRTEKQK
jgi:ABC-type glycerol-3-phosphate transport system substrate-binding protein